MFSCFRDSEKAYLQFLKPHLQKGRACLFLATESYVLALGEKDLRLNIHA